MSKCPYAAFLVSSLQQSTFSVAGILGISNITFNYIAKVDPSQPTGFDSKHGQNEVLGDFYELCVENVGPQNKIWDLVVCIDTDVDGIPSNIQGCATQVGGIDWNQVGRCFKNSASTLMKASIAKTDSLKIDNSPTLFVNGQCIYGSLPTCNNVDPTSDMVLQAICQAYTGSKPSGCPK